MHITSHSQYNKAYKKLSNHQKDLIDGATEIFLIDPHNHTLRTHPLKNELSGYWSFSIDDDLRILFSQKGDFKEVQFIKVGTHDTIYKTPIF